MLKNAIILGANETQSEKDLKEVNEFELKLDNVNRNFIHLFLSEMWKLKIFFTQITVPQEERRNNSAQYNPCTIKQLQELYPYLDWLDYVNSMLPPGLNVTENETVINSAPKFFERLGEVLNSTSKRTIANYLLFRVIFTTSNTLTSDLRKLQLELDQVVFGTQSEQPRWKECIQYALIEWVNMLTDRYRSIFLAVRIIIPSPFQLTCSIGSNLQ